MGRCACGACKQFDNYPGRPEEARLYNMPDYNWYKEFPSAGLEVIGVESNTYDDDHLGGDGWDGGSAQVPEACNMTKDQVKSFLRNKYEQGLALVKERARKTSARTVLTIQIVMRVQNLDANIFCREVGAAIVLACLVLLLSTSTGWATTARRLRIPT